MSAAPKRARHGGRRGRNGEGSVYKRQTAAGARYDLAMYDDRGNRIYRRFKTEEEAEAARRESLQRKDRGETPLPQRHTMSALFDAWLEELRGQVSRGERSPNTLARREECIRLHTRPALGRIECRRLTVQDVEAYLRALDASPSTRANHRAMLRRALNRALRWGWVERNVAAHSDPVPVRPQPVRALTLEDAQRLLDALQGSPLHALFVTALFTGLRGGELAGLRVEDIDLRAGAARIHQQIRRNPITRGLEVAPLKTYASSDTIELIPEVLAVLSDTIADRTSGYVWESAPGRPYWPTSFSHGLTAALQKAGLPHMRLHDLRHYFISFLPQLDVHPAVAQKLARHAAFSTTMNVYTSVEDGLKKQAMGKLHAALQDFVAVSVAVQAEEKLRILP